LEEREGRRAPESTRSHRGYDEQMHEAYLGSHDLTDDARALLAELERDVPGAQWLTADCRPAVDVFESANGLEVVVDVPGVTPDSLRVAIRRSILIIVGVKLVTQTAPSTRFHLAERSYGRFARVVRLNGAYDAAHARAVTRAGELRVTLPRLEDQRGQILRIPVERQ